MGGGARGHAAADRRSGQTVVVDGDSLKLDGQRIRLYGIDAPELPTPTGHDSRSRGDDRGTRRGGVGHALRLISCYIKCSAVRHMI
jgi:endonuclease YncB( thermonuclease family)